MSSWQPLALSFEVAFFATLLATTLGVLIGLWLTSRRLWGRDVIDAITSAPLVMPPTVLGYYVLVALGRNSAIGKAWEAIFGSSIVFTRTGAVVAATLGALPLVIKSARAALEGVDPTLLKAARTLGAGPMRAFFTVHLPLAARGLIAGVMLAFARSLGDFGVTLMVAGDIPGETQTAALAIYDMIQGHEERAAAGMVAVLTSITIGALYLVNKLTAVPREE
ncbi:MAG TPA: molybdate ABC transporter permease subunit [Polyangia bacterium]|nr:molybdate ABC transporter permease subunit [Polyangia bacterium]